MQLIGRKMVAGLEEGAQDGVALVGMLEAHLLQVLVEQVLGLAHLLARDGRLVVDPFWQHR